MTGAPTPSQQQAAASAAKETTAATFRQDVLTESTRQPVLVQLFSPRSEACRVLTAVLEKVVRGANGKVKLVTMNVEAHPQIAAQLGIQSVPAVVAFQRGQPADGFSGALPEAQVRGFVERLAGPLASPLADLLAEADALAAQGDMATAEEIYAEILAEEPGHAKARAALAKLHLAAGELEQAKFVLAQAPAAAAKDAAIVAVQTAVELAEQAAAVGDVSHLERSVAQEPKNRQARFDLALALNGHGRREEAADALLEIIRTDRKWQDDGARRQLVQFFEAWGPMDPATLAARRKLSSLLFS